MKSQSGASIQTLIRHINELPDAFLALFAACFVTLVAGATRFAGIDASATGFRIEESSNALYAQTINSGTYPIFFGEQTDAHDALFIYLIRLVGEISGWGVTGPREAAAALGTVTVVACTLWYIRAAGFWIGTVGGLLVATSFWQLMFGRQAIEYIALAAVSSLGLLTLWIACGPCQPPAQRSSTGSCDCRCNREVDSTGIMVRWKPRGPSMKPQWAWFIVAGLIFGVGVYVHPAFRFVLPAVFVCAGFLIWRSPQGIRRLLLTGSMLGLVVILIAMTPLSWYYLENLDDFRRGFDASGGLLAGNRNAAWEYLTALQSFVWEGSHNQQTNIPGRALLNPILAFWTVTGLFIALRHPLKPIHGIALIWFVFAILPAALLSADEPGLLLAATPVVFLFPVLSISTVFSWVTVRFHPEDDQDPQTGSSNTGFSWVASHAAPALALFCALSIVGSIGWSLNDYFRNWSTDARTYVAMRGDVRDAVEATYRLPSDGWPIYISAGDAERIVRYLAPDRTHRIYTNRALLPMTSKGGSYLVYAESTAPDDELVAWLPEENLIDAGRQADSNSTFQIWFLNALARQELPYIVPAVPYENGFGIHGFDIRTASTATPEDPEVSVTLIWSTPVDGDPYLSMVRLWPPGEVQEEQATSDQTELTPWKYQPDGYRELIMTHHQVIFPDIADGIAELQVALIDPSNNLVSPRASITSTEDNIYVTINRIGLVQESP